MTTGQAYNRSIELSTTLGELPWAVGARGEAHWHANRHPGGLARVNTENWKIALHNAWDIESLAQGLLFFMKGRKRVPVALYGCLSHCVNVPCLGWVGFQGPLS
jgi:hypothetical protein